MIQIEENRSRFANRFIYFHFGDYSNEEEGEERKKENICLHLPLNNQAFHKHADVLLADL